MNLKRSFFSPITFRIVLSNGSFQVCENHVTVPGCDTDEFRETASLFNGEKAMGGFESAVPSFRKAIRSMLGGIRNLADRDPAEWNTKP